MKRLIVFALFEPSLVAMAIGADRPALQPFPRDCTWGDGVVDAAELPVVRDDSRQCEIGAAELPVNGERRLIGNIYESCKPYRTALEGKSKLLVEPLVINE